MNLKFAIVSRAHHFSRERISIRVFRAVDGVDVDKRQFRDMSSSFRLDNEEPALAVPIDGADARDVLFEEVFADNAADAVNFAAETAGVVRVVWEAEVCFVVGGVGGVFGRWAFEGFFYGAQGAGVGGVDFDFLQEEEVGEVVVTKKVAEGGAECCGVLWGFVGRGWTEEGCNGGLDVGCDAVDVPGVDGQILCS